MSGSGLALSRGYFSASLPLLKAAMPDLLNQAAAGLAGDGSECLGVDDDISRDHDWGPGFCLWLPDDVLPQLLPRIEAALATLADSYEGFPARMRPERRAGRVGPMGIGEFYARHTGFAAPPETWQQWRAIPEAALAACTNGEVFSDVPGQFSAIRNKLLAFYPDDVLRKKLAARCMIMAQAGQYNLPRSLQRGELGAAMLAAARFAEAALSMAFLLNRRYMPFYKWSCRLAHTLRAPGPQTAEVVELLAATNFASEEQGLKALNAIEDLCDAVAKRLRQDGLARAEGNWLWALGPEIQLGIREPELRRLDVMRD